MAYCVWVIRDGQEVTLFDAGFSVAGAATLDRSARVTVQCRELEFWPSPMGARRIFASATADSNIECMLRLVRDGRCELRDTDACVAPGVSAHHVGGHSPVTR
jgi:hypothetical protein